ncbi:hypothetical protein ABEF95_010853 [Exophiala dermatitidis]
MPRKYSHCAVLAAHSSHIPYLPSDQPVDGFSSLTVSPPCLTPQLADPPSNVKRALRSPTLPSDEQNTLSSYDRTSVRKGQPQSGFGDMPGRLLDNISNPRRPRLILDWHGGIEDDGPHSKHSQRYQSVSMQSRSSPGLPSSASFEPYIEKEVYLPQLDLQVSEQNTPTGTNAPTRLARPRPMSSQKFQPRNDVESFQQLRDPRGLRSPSRSHGGEPLLSVQEFLDSSPSLKQNMSPRSRQSSTMFPAPYKYKEPPQCPPLHNRKNKSGYMMWNRQPANPLRRQRTDSFGDSSGDDIDFVHSSPVNTVQGLTPRVTVWSDEKLRQRKIMDLTRELEILTGQKVHDTRWDEESAQPPHGKQTGKNRRSFGLSDQDDSELSELDGVEVRPLRRYRSLSRTRSNNLRRPSEDRDSIFLVPDDQLTPLTPHSTRSLDSVVKEKPTLATTPDSQTLTYSKPGGGDYFSSMRPGAAHMSRRSVDHLGRAFAKDIPRAVREVNPVASNRVATAIGPDLDSRPRVRRHSVSAADRLEQSSEGPELGAALRHVYGLQTQSRTPTLNFRPSFPVSATSHPSQASPTSPSGPRQRVASSTTRHGSSTPPFGVPSIVRNPEKIAAINAEAQRRSSATPIMRTSDMRQAVSTPAKKGQRYLLHKLSFIRNRNASATELSSPLHSFNLENNRSADRLGMKQSKCRKPSIPTEEEETGQNWLSGSSSSPRAVASQRGSLDTRPRGAPKTREQPDNVEGQFIPDDEDDNNDDGHGDLGAAADKWTLQAASNTTPSNAPPPTVKSRLRLDLPPPRQRYGINRYDEDWDHNDNIDELEHENEEKRSHAGHEDDPHGGPSSASALPPPDIARHRNRLRRQPRSHSRSRSFSLSSRSGLGFGFGSRSEPYKTRIRTSSMPTSSGGVPLTFRSTGTTGGDDDRDDTGGGVAINDYDDDDDGNRVESIFRILRDGPILPPPAPTRTSASTPRQKPANMTVAAAAAAVAAAGSPPPVADLRSDHNDPTTQDRLKPGSPRKMSLSMLSMRSMSMPHNDWDGPDNGDGDGNGNGHGGANSASGSGRKRERRKSVFERIMMGGRRASVTST